MPPSAMRGCATGSGHLRAPRRSAPARRTWSRARPSRRSTGCRCSCCRATCSRRAGPTRCCSSSRSRRAGMCRSTMLHPRLALLRPDLASRAARIRRARRDARPHLAGRDRRGHPGAAAGRPGRGVRLARGAVRTPRLARPSCRARRGGARACRRRDPFREAAADRRGRRRDLQRSDGRARDARRRDGHPRRPRPRPGRDRCLHGHPLLLGRGRCDWVPRREPDRSRRRSRRRDRHALDGLHDRVEHGVPASAVRVDQRRRARLGEARDLGHCRRAGRARGVGRGTRRAGRSTDATARRPSAWCRNGTTRSTGCSRSAIRPAGAERGDRRGERGGRAGRGRRLRGRLDARRPREALAQCATRRATTSNTGTRAWATRSQAGSA